MDAITRMPLPTNEPILTYAPGATDRLRLESRLKEMGSQSRDLPLIIAGKPVMGAGQPIEVVQPHRFSSVLGTMHNATAAEVAAAVRVARDVSPAWQSMPFDERAAIFLRAADLLSGPYRYTLNAATMLGQSKTCFQSEIDAAAELIDFWRFNVHYARQLLSEQPDSAAGTWNRMDYRPLDGFVLAITPFNFTSIAGNLPTAPALMGNTVVWKPSPTQQLAASYTMELLAAAGLPPGVINMVTGDGQAVSEVAVIDSGLAGIHFTGSTQTFQYLWKRVGQNIGRYNTYPRLVGETGGKNFIIAHPSADEAALRTALVRGAFEYQGQKCSAASRAYIAKSTWNNIRADLTAEVESLRMGDPADFSNFLSAVIDARAFAKHRDLLDHAKNDSELEIIAGGRYDDSEGWFIRPTVLQCANQYHDAFTKEYFGPILSIYVYEEEDWASVMQQAAHVAPYRLTGSIFAEDRTVLAEAEEVLRFAAGNLYLNDKPTGAVVGQQPFGGSGLSGTNDKAGSPLNLLRWVSPRVIKETFVPATDYRYPHMG